MNVLVHAEVKRRKQRLRPVIARAAPWLPTDDACRLSAAEMRPVIDAWRECQAAIIRAALGLTSWRANEQLVDALMDEEVRSRLAAKSMTP